MEVMRNRLVRCQSWLMSGGGQLHQQPEHLLVGVAPHNLKISLSDQIKLALGGISL